MNDAFRHAGRSGGIENIERMGEGQAGEFDGLRRKCARASSQAFALAVRENFCVIAEIGNDQRRSMLGILREDLSDLVADRDAPCRYSNSHRRRLTPWLDLPETVEYALHAEIGRCARPDCARATKPRASPMIVSGILGISAATRSPGANAERAIKLLRPADGRVKFRPCQSLARTLSSPQKIKALLSSFLRSRFSA